MKQREKAVAGFKRAYGIEPPEDWHTERIIRAIDEKVQLDIPFPSTVAESQYAEDVSKVQKQLKDLKRPIKVVTPCIASKYLEFLDELDDLIDKWEKEFKS
jgi:hypothetical protein